MALLESLLAIVAAITLVVLNYVFITQRQSELGVLNALGFSRLKLIWRTLRETVLTTSAAWIVSIILCLIGLIYQGLTFAARGLSYDWANPIPWLFTLPIPIAVLLATSGTVAWMLSKLDPAAINRMPAAFACSPLTGLWTCGRVLRTSPSPAGRVDNPMDNCKQLPTG
jgi:ABC-type antimicrobial peptide transport system permease subunit